MDILGTLMTIADEISTRFDNVNRGGCCVFASMVAARLCHYVPMRIAVVDYDGNDVDLDEVRPCLEDKLNIWNWYENHVRFNHVIIEFLHEGKTHYYDSNGVSYVFSESEYHSLLDGGLTLREAVALASQRSGWNPRFDRNQISAMAEVINTIFDDALVAS